VSYSLSWATPVRAPGAAPVCRNRALTRRRQLGDAIRHHARGVVMGISLRRRHGRRRSPSCCCRPAAHLPRRTDEKTRSRARGRGHRHATRRQGGRGAAGVLREPSVPRCRSASSRETESSTSALAMIKSEWPDRASGMQALPTSCTHAESRTAANTEPDTDVRAFASCPGEVSPFAFRT
jgi:hypothetical protein